MSHLDDLPKWGGKPESSSVRIGNAARTFYSNIKDTVKFPLRHEQSCINSREIFDDDGKQVFQIFADNEITAVHYNIAEQFCNLVNAIAKENEG